MKLETNYWICDSCGEKINKLEDGYLQWLNVKRDDVTIRNNMKIVHHNTVCQFNEKVEYSTKKATVGDMSLDHFAGPDGLTRLLEMISDDMFEDKEEVLEIIKRIHIPGYEKSRPYFERAVREGVFEPNTKLKYFVQRDLESIKNHYKID